MTRITWLEEKFPRRTGWYTVMPTADDPQGFGHTLASDFAAGELVAIMPNHIREVHGVDLEHNLVIVKRGQYVDFVLPEYVDKTEKVKP